MPARLKDLRIWSAPLKSDRLIAHNLIVGSGTILAGVLGVVFQSLVSHRLQPADYGAVFAVVTLLTLIGLPASAFTLLMARETSRDRASGRQAPSAALLGGGNRVLLGSGAALAAVLIVLSPLMGRFLNVPAEFLLAAAAGIPFGLALPLMLGEFQGEQRFLAFSILSVGQASLKLVGAVTLGSIWGSIGIIAGISLASAVMYVVAVRLLRRKLSIKPRLSWWRPAASYLTVVMPSTLALAVLLTADVLLVKHFFSTQVAGEFAAIAALGRAIFWGASGVATVLFPKVTFRATRGGSGIRIVGASLVLVVLGGLAGLAVLSFSSHWLLVGFAGQTYDAGAAYLPWYGIGMILLGANAILIATHQTLGKPGFLAVLLPLTLLEPALLFAFHQSLTQVVLVVDVTMALVAVGLGALYVVQQRMAPVLAATPELAPSSIAQAG